MTSPQMLADLRARVRPELACLGDAGAPLVALLGAVESVGAQRPCEALDDPGFALDLLSEGADAVLVGRLLDYLRTRRNDTTPGIQPLVSPTASSSAVHVTAADVVASYEAGPLAMLAKGSARTYRTWSRRLADAHSDTDPRALTTGDLRDLIAHHVLARRDAHGGDRRVSRSAEEHGVAAYRHLWNYLVQTGWATENVAMELQKPPRRDPNRRDIRPDEDDSVELRATSGEPMSVCCASPRRGDTTNEASAAVEAAAIWPLGLT